MDVMSKFSTSDQTVDEALQNTSLLESASIVFIAVGAFLFIVSFAGCCGALKESPCLLVLVSLESPTAGGQVTIVPGFVCDKQRRDESSGC